MPGSNDDRIGPRKDVVLAPEKSSVEKKKITLIHVTTGHQCLIVIMG